MTVADLIARLAEMPPDAPVVMSSKGDRQASEPENVSLTTEDHETFVWIEGT